MALVKFGDIVKDVKCNVDRNKNPYEYYIAGDHMDSEDLTIHRFGNFVTDDVGPAFTRIFKPGQILYGSRRTYLKKVAVADFEGICANTTFVLESKDESLFEQRLLPFIMLSDDFTQWSVSHSKGSTNPYILFSDLANYEFELPSLSEQRVLADKLWAAYRLKESYKKLLKATDEMVKSQFIEMFENCRRTSFKDCVTISKTSINPQPGTMYTLYSFPAYDNHQEPEVTDGGEIKSSKVVLKENVVLYNKLNVRLSRVWNIEKLNTQNNICSSEFLPIKSKDNSIMTQQFIYQLLKSDYVTKKMVACSTGTSNSQKRITPSSLMDLEVPIPSIALQQQFVSIAEQADKSKFELNKSIEAIDQVIKSLINN